MEQYTPMIRQYLAVKANYPDAFLFFRLGDFYELFFEDAIQAARELEITLTGRDGGGTERIPMCGVPHHAAEGYIKTLVQRGYKVAICEQVEDPKSAKGVVRREVTRVITPGTIMDGSMLSVDNNYLGMLVTDGQQYGVAFCDITTGEFYSPKIVLSDWLSTLEEVLPFAPKEIVIPKSFPREALKELKSHIQTTVTWIDELIGIEEATQYLVNIFDQAHLQLPQLNVIASGQLLAYLMTTQKRSIGHIQQIHIYEPNRHMILDPFTRRNLELIETVRNKSKYGSLLWLLDQTVTPMGSRMLKRWMDKPLISADQIDSRLDAVQFFVSNSLLRVEVQHMLKQVYDIERLAGRISYGNVNGRDLLQLRKSLEIIPSIVEIFMQSNHSLPAMIHFIQKIDTCSDLRMQLERAIVDDPPITITEGGVIREGYSAQLDDLRLASRDGKQWIANLEQKERETTGIKSLKVGYNKVFGYYIEVTKANLSALPKDRYERKQTLANAERFVTQELKEKEQLILQAEERIVQLEYELFVELRKYLEEHIPRIQSLAHQMAILDVIIALAELAEKNRYVRPKISTNGVHHIVDGRHPVIEAVLEKGHYIPNSTHFDPDHLIYLITGPNMAGKSTYMRQVAMIQILFQIGSFVPAKEAELTIVDRIFTRIGAADDLVEGQSTFMVEMNEIKVTTTQATSNSLVIIDELGRGTSTQDGIAIAQAVIEYLHDKIGCKTLVSTHFHELASLEGNLPKLMNYHMAVLEQGNDVRFTRQLIAGAASKSYGVYCAQLAGLPSRIIERANQLIAKMEKIDQVEQMDLFLSKDVETTHVSDPTEKEVVQYIQAIDLLNMTPLQAMQVLFELKNKVSQLK